MAAGATLPRVLRLHHLIPTLLATAAIAGCGADDDTSADRPSTTTQASAAKTTSTASKQPTATEPARKKAKAKAKTGGRGPDGPAVSVKSAKARRDAILRAAAACRRKPSLKRSGGFPCDIAESFARKR